MRGRGVLVYPARRPPTADRRPPRRIHPHRRPPPARAPSSPRSPPMSTEPATPPPGALPGAPAQPPRRSPLFRPLKRVRDVASDAVAAVALRWEPAEQALAATGRALHGRWSAFDLLYRRATDTLALRRLPG